MTNLLQRARAAFHLVRTGSIPAKWFERPGLEWGAGDGMTRPYEQSGYVMRAIKIIAAPISAVPVYFEDPADDEIEIEDERLATFWEAPALGQSGLMGFGDVIEATVGWLKLSGEAFWLATDDAMVPFPEARGSFPPFMVARPDRMRAVFDQRRFKGWEFSDGAGRRWALLPDQVFHLKFWNPYDDLRGLAEFSGAATTAEADFMASQYQRNLWKNNGDRGPIIGVKGAMPTDEQRDQIISQLREKQLLARQGIFKAAFIPGEIAVEDPKAQVPDAAFIASRINNRQEIYAVLGVPPSMAEVAQSYSIGSASDRFRLIEDTCMPLAAKIGAVIGRLSGMFIGRPVRACFDWDEHSVMQQVRSERVVTAVQLWDRGMAWRDVNDYLRLGLPEFKGWDTAYLPFSVAPADSLGDALPDTSLDYAEALPAPAPAPEDEEDDALDAMTEALRQRIADPETEKRAALWRVHMQQRREAIKLYQTKFNRELIKARAEVLRKLGALEGKAVTRAGAAADFLFDLDAFRQGFLGAMRDSATRALQMAGQQLFTEIKRDDPFQMPPPKAMQFLVERENKLVNTPQDIFEQVRSALQTGLNEGDSIAALSNRIRDEFNGISRERATRIAMTETAAAYGTARQEAMEQAGVRYKKWLTSGNANVRPAHAQAGRDYSTPIPVDEPFRVGGENLMYPGDPTGSPENIINCHCVAISVEGEA